MFEKKLSIGELLKLEALEAGLRPDEVRVLRLKHEKELCSKGFNRKKIKRRK